MDYQKILKEKGIDPDMVDEVERMVMGVDLMSLTKISIRSKTMLLLLGIVLAEVTRTSAPENQKNTEIEDMIYTELEEIARNVDPQTILRVKSALRGAIDWMETIPSVH